MRTRRPAAGCSRTRRDDGELSGAGSPRIGPESTSACRMPNAAARAAMPPAMLRRGRGGLGDAVVLHHDQQRQPPQRGHVQRLVDRALAPGAVADVDAGDRAGCGPLQVQRDAGGDRHALALHAGGQEAAAVEVLAAADAAADRARPAHDLGEQPCGSPNLGEVVAVAAWLLNTQSRCGRAAALTATAGSPGRGRCGWCRRAVPGRTGRAALLEAADRGCDAVVVGERRGAIGDRERRRRVRGGRHAGSGLSARSSAAQNSATARRRTARGRR